MFLINSYRFIKPLVGKNQLLKRLLIKYGQISHLLPKVLTIALTYKCQCHCAHCGIADYQNKEKKELTTEEVKGIIDDARRIRSIVQITFTGGEPLLRKDIYELIVYSRNRNFFTKIDSNAVLLNRDRLVKLKEAGLDRVGISIDHYKEAVHDKLRGYDGLFQKVIMAVSLCHDIKMSCYLQTYITRQWLDNGDLEKLLVLAEGLNVEKIKIQTPAIIGSSRDNREMILTHEDFVSFAKIISKHRSAYVESEFFSPLDYKKFCDFNLRTNIYITSYGDVSPCCFLPLSFGNIRESCLLTILSNMYKSRAFKKLLTFDGCLCSNQEFLKEYIGRSRCLPIRIDKRHDGAIPSPEVIV